MSENESHHHGKNDIIIIKRHGGHDGGHHGGAWKIAYADFMTAMMAFFLVMWLVNAANEDTKAAVASYFNPIKLTDSKPAKRSSKKPADSKDGEAKQEKAKVEGESKSAGEGAATGEDKSASAGKEILYTDANYFENPYAVLSEIVLDVSQKSNISEKSQGGASSAGPATGADGGDAYRDPFNPDFWTEQVKVTELTPPKAGQADTPLTKAEKADQSKSAPKADAPLAIKPEDIKPLTGDTPAPEKKKVETAKKETPPKPEKADENKTAEAQNAADQLRDDIQKELGGSLGKVAESLTVESAEGGLLVSIMEKSESPMFNVGSAVPKRELIMAMEKIGRLLQARKGQIAIRGHTDSRPFKSGGDNWDLSVNRAHSAYFMLVRGGLDEKRVSQVTGYADRRLKIESDPMADANRRIEILIQADADKG
ncbi:MAG: flagellar motor protein MotB [Pseudomonadota bacterium]